MVIQEVPHCGKLFVRAMLLLTAFALSAVAQVTTGSILGTVKDNTGAAVKNAKVTVTEVGKSTSTNYTTDDEGNYTAPFLIPGSYSVTVEATGFKKAVVNGVIVQIDQKARTNFNLEIDVFLLQRIFLSACSHNVRINQPYY